MFRKFPPENPCGNMLEEIIQPRPIERRVAENRRERPPRMKEFIHALNLHSRYGLGAREANGAKTA